MDNLHNARRGRPEAVERREERRRARVRLAARRRRHLALLRLRNKPPIPVFAGPSAEDLEGIFSLFVQEAQGHINKALARGPTMKDVAEALAIANVGLRMMKLLPMPKGE